MTPRQPFNPDAITQLEAAEILGVKPGTVRRLLREGVLHRVKGQHPILSKAEVEQEARNPHKSEWITGSEAARILGISTTRVWQLALKDRLPWELAENGRRKYRRSQIEVVSNARQMTWHPVEDLPPKIGVRPGWLAD